MLARSSAITAAAPRKNVNGDSTIRSWRIGNSSGTRSASCSRRRPPGRGDLARASTRRDLIAGPVRAARGLGLCGSQVQTKPCPILSNRCAWTFDAHTTYSGRVIREIVGDAARRCRVTISAHAQRPPSWLGAVRLRSGPRPRLAFSPARASRSGSRRSKSRRPRHYQSLLRRGADASVPVARRRGRRCCMCGPTRLRSAPGGPRADAARPARSVGRLTPVQKPRDSALRQTAADATSERSLHTGRQPREQIRKPIARPP